MLCSSSGNSSGSFGVLSSGSFVSLLLVFVVSGFDSICFFFSVGILIFGMARVISGFFWRIISVVVATYRGGADNIKMPKTKPANPCNWACISLCHWAPLKMLKLNMKSNMAHIVNTYAIVHSMTYLCVEKMFKIFFI